MLRRIALLFSILLAPAAAQVVVINNRAPRGPVVPVRSDVQIRAVDIHADVNDQAAKIQLSQVFRNPSLAPMEAVALFPVPEGAAVSGLTLMADGKELAGHLLTREEARRRYEEVVSRRRDPALLEYMGRELFQTSVFPVPPGGESTVQIRYSQLLKKDNGLIDLVIPLGNAKQSARPVETLSVAVQIAASAPIRTVYSPTHQTEITRPDGTHATVKATLHQVAGPDDLRLLYSTDANPVGLNVISYKPAAGEDGYFVLFATPEARAERTAQLPKSAVFVCDRSGSMSGKKMEQAKAALQFLVRQLQAGDTFNIIAYDSEVEAFRPELQRANAASVHAALAWVDGLHAGGGTNIDGAMRRGLAFLSDASRPNYLLFLTDGQPTEGETREAAIAANAAAENKAHARLFVFGVGFDVNSRLLDRMARELRGQSIYVRPSEDIEAPVSALWAKVGSPMLTDVAVNLGLEDGVASRIYPKQMPDLFRGDQLVLVGRYRKGGDVKVELTGSAGGKKQNLTYHAKFADGSHDESDAFVARLWATRRIGEIIDQLDLHGRNQELIDELVGLSQRHGILTPYTSFLADEQVSLNAIAANRARAAGEVMQLVTVSGQSGFDQRALKGQMQNASVASAPTPPMAMPRVDGASRAQSAPQVIKQVGQKAFFKKEKIWQDSTVTAEQAKHAIRVVQFSSDYFDLAVANGGTMAHYIAFDEPVIVNLGAKTYRIDPE